MAHVPLVTPKYIFAPAIQVGDISTIFEHLDPGSIQDQFRKKPRFSFNKVKIHIILRNLLTAIRDTEKPTEISA